MWFCPFCFFLFLGLIHLLSPPSASSSSYSTTVNEDVGTKYSALMAATPLHESNCLVSWILIQLQVRPMSFSLELSFPVDFCLKKEAVVVLFANELLCKA